VLAPEHPLQRGGTPRWARCAAAQVIELAIDLGPDGDAHRRAVRWNERSI
jgi:hypothetical protein